ncbi:nardilysin [Lasioglossum baleicum]|uniref:nardilysin n=1 Tax=Lasioglossum baleicum TaxID=434251 RepID=UPI003FCE2617
MVTRLQRFFLFATKNRNFLKVPQCGIKRAPSLTIMSNRYLQTPPEKKLKTIKTSIDSTKNVTTSTEHNLKNANTILIDSMKTENINENIPSDVTATSPVKAINLDVPIKSGNDKKDYRVIQLENGLTALLISDMHSLASVDCNGEVKANAISSDIESEEDEEDDEDDEDEEDEEDEESECEGDDEEEDEEDTEDDELGAKDSPSHKKRVKREEKLAACGLSVGVGSFSDPAEIPGLAHFLEHMVFMGSSKYPQENDFDAFIKKRGGSDNASTDCEVTTFYFEIQEKHLLSALDRFAQFFIEPLMKKDAINRERESVDSEFQMALPSDTYRKEQLLCSFAKPDHPASKFMWGNIVTLRDNIVEENLYKELHKFRERHYSAHRMKLAVQAKFPLDVLEDYVKQCFSKIPNNGLPPHDFTQFKGANSFDTSSFRRIYKIKPVKDVCTVELTWAMPTLLDLYKGKPNQYVSQVVGHKGKGSLISYLKKKMWCLNMYIREGDSGFEHSSMYLLFGLTLKLTEQGHKHLQEVLNAVFSYINMIRREGPQKQLYDEFHKIRETSFRYRDEEPPVDIVEDLCENMHYFPPEHYITGNHLYFEYNPEDIQACMDYLTPDNVNIIISDKKFNDEEFEKVEPWFKTKYTDTEIPKEWVECWRVIDPFPEFHLPLPNVFLTDDFSLISIPAEVPKYPTKIYSDRVTEIWYRPDPKFRLPECFMHFYILSPAARYSPKSAAMMDLYISILNHLLEEELFPAVDACLGCEIYTGDKGIIVEVNGFNQKVPLLLFTIAKYIADYATLLTKDLFDVIKKDLTKLYYNKFLRPNKLADDTKLSILLLSYWSLNAKHMALGNVEFDEFQNFVKHLTDHVYIQSLVQGNMTKDDVVKNVQSFVDTLKCGPLLPDTMPQIRVTQIPMGSHVCKIRNFNKTDANSVVSNYYQSGVTSTELSVIIELLIMIMEEPLFHRLRTEEQLGYDVFCLARDTCGILGYSITACVQADKFVTEHVDSRIESFLIAFKEGLEAMSETEFETVKEAYTKQKQCADITLQDEVNRNWAEISTADYMFDKIERKIVMSEHIKIEQLKEWIESHTINGSNSRKLSVHVVGTPKPIDSKKSNEIIDSRDTKGKDGESETDSEKTGTAKYPLDYISSPECEKDTSTVNYITDVQQYKSRLYTYPVQHIVS